MIDHDGGPIVRVVQRGKILNHLLCNFRSISNLHILVSILLRLIIWKCKRGIFFLPPDGSPVAYLLNSVSHTILRIIS